MVPHHIEPAVRTRRPRERGLPLYDDLLDLSRLQEEHMLKRVIRKHTGDKGVLEWMDLLETSCEDAPRQTCLMN